MPSEGGRRSSATDSEAVLIVRGLGTKVRISAMERSQLRGFARQLVQAVAVGSTFTCLLTDNRKLQQLNSSFLGHDYPTDVLSFPSGAFSGDLGEIAISAEMAQLQAQEFAHGLMDELRILMLHGLLHLTGLDHENDHGEMARAERKWRVAFGLPNGLIARSGRARKVSRQ
jgi:probable rRNA maturation factor